MPYGGCERVELLAGHGGLGALLVTPSCAASLVPAHVALCVSLALEHPQRVDHFPRLLLGPVPRWQAVLRDPLDGAVADEVVKLLVASCLPHRGLWA